MKWIVDVSAAVLIALAGLDLTDEDLSQVVADLSRKGIKLSVSALRPKSQQLAEAITLTRALEKSYNINITISVTRFGSRPVVGIAMPCLCSKATPSLRRHGRHLTSYGLCLDVLLDSSTVGATPSPTDIFTSHGEFIVLQL
ncbi:uncharacterized protein JN550_005605 [Neoarthrinium moseri]|uniref:uncharacterized protein n=1 Tax=Neoarthrinium moseri TaxID=1658444 RepID=UPI001FDAFBDB|nr:uncharacterized protein JN550_005605 [Neoarthrinium moseri]KAI1870015.1 hypothetical protein JN550_005605 [Neoarthrinium moseri]